MPEVQPPMFGGRWTERKLEMLRKYLLAYTTALKDQPFELTYIDGFAGTGYRTLRLADDSDSLLFPELASDESQEFLDGSARIALSMERPFDNYVFIERDRGRARQLEQLRDEYAYGAERVLVVCRDCNEYLREFCGETDWRGKRAVLFLDPFGMQVEWRTLEAVAATEAIDLWILFPLGMGVMRVLPKKGEMPESWARRLDAVFGNRDWREAFYSTRIDVDLYGETQEERRRVATFESITEYWIMRLKSIFAGVAENPKRLINSTGNPLYLMCFAAANPKGAPIALRIAQDILGRED